MCSGSNKNGYKRVFSLLLTAAIAVLFCACGAAPAAEAPAVITPAPILTELPVNADETAVDYASYLLGEWVSTEPVVDGTWYLYSKYVSSGIAGLRAVKPKGNPVDYSQFDEEHWIFGELTPGTYEVTDDLLTNDFQGKIGYYEITWDSYDSMTLDSGTGDVISYYRVK